MRAERLIAVLMLLKRHERLTAAQLAAELGVSERTVLRDIDSLSLSGVPVYAERGRRGGFALLPGYRTDLTGLTVDEATSLLAGTGRLDSPAFASAMRKVAAAMPDPHREQAVRAAQRVLVRPEGFVREAPELAALAQIQEAVFTGRRVRLRYARRGAAEAALRVLDPIGLIAAGDVWYLVAGTAESERMYRVSRMSGVEVLDEPADRRDEVDLAEVWERRRTEFRAQFTPLDVVIDCAEDDLAKLGEPAILDVVGEPEHLGERVRVTVRFGDGRRALRVLWSLLFDVALTVVEPEWLRDQLRERVSAATMSG